jgi:hypothetical protein
MRPAQSNGSAAERKAVNQPIDASDAIDDYPDIETFLRALALMRDTPAFAHMLGKGMMRRWQSAIEAAASAIEHDGREADLSHVECPSEQIWSTYVVTHKDGRGENVYLDADDVAEYNADPDLFVAKHFGFTTIEHYREWVETSQAALCSEHTKTGTLCRNSIGMTYRPEVWRPRHRSGPCFAHAKEVGS